jgi:hypothetical protein
MEGMSPRWRHPAHPNEIFEYFVHYKKHMEIDFAYNNDFIFSPDYLHLVLGEWLRVAKLQDDDSDDPEFSSHHGGFITLEDFTEISCRMKEIHEIDSWGLNSEELRTVSKEEFSAEDYMSLRRFCLYVEREELYDDEENALRLIQPQDYYASKFAPQRKRAYIGGTYESYRLCCLKQLSVDLEIRANSNRENNSPETLLDWYAAAFEAEDPDRTGYIDRVSLLRVLYELVASGTIIRRHHQQPALSLLGQAILILQKARDDASTTWNNARTDELDAIIRVDSEFAGNTSHDFGSSIMDDNPGARQHLDVSSYYRVSLRQFCTSVERPDYDYHSFQTDGFQKRVRDLDWTRTLHSVLCRYFRNTLFQKQVMTMLLMNRRRGILFGPFSDDVLFTIVSFLPRDLRCICNIA